ncbi:hypothetical protein MP228_002457 [Amoeboaphelidium protococcarum]|nr:hypothetical protein MP228_002457 [Amoeboaphelidium protococcarum]
MQKFSNLPDIDTDGQDVFESQDVVLTEGSRQRVRIEEDFASNMLEDVKRQLRLEKQVAVDMEEDIVREHLSSKQAQSKFKDAVLDTIGVDFTNRLAQRRQAMYQAALHGSTKLLSKYGGGGDASAEDFSFRSELRESPLDKFRRLTFEVEELKRELSQGGATAASQTGQQNENQDPLSCKSMLKHLEQIESDLQSQRGFAGVQSESSAAKSDGIEQQLQSLNFQRSNDQVAKMVSQQIEQIKSISTSMNDKQFGELLGKLSQFEKLVGLDSLDDESVPVNIIDTISKLEKDVKLLLQPGKLDGLSLKCHNLIAELDSISSRSTVELVSSSDILQRKAIGDLYNLLEQSRTHLHLLPQLLTKISSMKPLIMKAQSLTESVDLISSEQSKLTTNIESCKSLLDKFESTLASNQEQVLKLLKQRQE